MKKFILILKRALFQSDYFYCEKTVLSTFSGGQDSILTLIIFLHFQFEYGLQLQMIYCHHFLQLNNFFCFWQLTRISYVFGIPTSMVLAQEYLKNENHARKWRQRSFERMCQHKQCSDLLLGHTATDKLETILSNLKRGLSSRGLTSLKLRAIFENISIFSFFTFIFRRKKSLTSRKQSCKQKFSKNLNILWLRNLELIKIKNLALSFYRHINRHIQMKRKKYNHLILYCFNHPTNSDTLSEFSKTKNEIFRIKFIISNEISYSNYFFKVKKSFFLRRPILKYHRTDITKICQIYNFPILTDETNQFLDISRNSIRYQLLPLFRYFFSLNVEFFSSRCFDILLLEQEYIYSKIENILKLLKTKLREKNKFLETLSVVEKRIAFQEFSSRSPLKFLSPNIYETNKLEIRRLFKNLPIAVQRICLRKLFSDSTKIELNYSQIELLRLFIQKS